MLEKSPVQPPGQMPRRPHQAQPTAQPDPNSLPEQQSSRDPAPAVETPGSLAQVVSAGFDELSAVESTPPPGNSADALTPKPPPMPERLPVLVKDPEPALDVQALLKDYAAGVKEQVLEHKRYPQVAQRLGHTGDVQVGFTIGADGELASLRLKGSSGWEELDTAALEAVRSAAPFEAPPAASGRTELALSITLKYVLQ